MSHKTLDRLSGLALMAAFLLSLTGGLLHPIVGHESHSAASISQPGFPVAHVLVFLGGAFLLIGLPGVYARIAPRPESSVSWASRSTSSPTPRSCRVSPPMRPS